MWITHKNYIVNVSALSADNIMIFVMEMRQVFSSISSFGSLKIVFRVLMQNIKKLHKFK